MSEPSHRAAAGINERARRHYPRLKAEAPAPEMAPDLTPSEPETDDDQSIASLGSGWDGHKSDLDWPIETGDPWMLGLGIAALFVMGLGVLTLLGGIGFGLWSLGGLLFHSLD